MYKIYKFGHIVSGFDTAVITKLYYQWRNIHKDLVFCQALVVCVVATASYTNHRFDGHLCSC